MKLAAIDLGSNSIHMIVVAVDPETGAFHVIDREREMVKLGSGTFKSGRLGEDAVRQAIETMDRLAALAQRHGATEVLAVATSAIREAKNGRELLDVVERRTGVAIRVIDGTAEAELIWRGVGHAVDLDRERVLTIDVGGGSVEMIVGDARRIRLAESLPLGVQRLRDLFAGVDPLPWARREELTAHVRATAGPTLARAATAGFDVVLGTSGTVLALGLAAIRARGADPWSVLDGQIVTRQELSDLASQLFDMDAAARARVSGVDDRRADTIHLAAGLLVTLLELARVDRLRLSGATLREGLVVEWLARRGHGVAPADVRRESVTELLARLGQAHDAHVAHVARLALALFDGTQRIHGLGPVERELCEHAARLSDLGRGISHLGHEHLAFHLIRGGGLRGFTIGEVDLIALAARYHRKGNPKPRHAHFAELDTAERQVVKVLAGLIRLADGLDRGRTGAVTGVQCDIDRHRVRVTATGGPEAMLEVQAAQKNLQLLTRALDRAIEIRLLPLGA